tara:strand:- start:376 stop:606 length:231 start_codon:yes stop_codon:yes gene_type:complete
MNKSREWLFYNAVMAWLVNYADKEEVLTPQYRKLLKELEDEQYLTIKTQKRGRPAKRARTKKTTSNPSSTEKNETT